MLQPQSTRPSRRRGNITRPALETITVETCMSAYLKFFELEQSPFEGKTQSQVVLGTRALREAFATIQKGLEDAASRIVVNGERGLGKTSLARALPKLLGSDFRVALVRDPSVAWESLRNSLARQWGIENGALARSRLVATSHQCRLVLVIDQAERATQDFLDHLDVLLSYRSEADRPVVQSVLLARLRCDPGEEPAPLIWWLDRIQTLQLEFAPLPRDGVEPYIHKHLKRAGWRGGQLFSLEAALAIHEYTGGIPGEVSGLCEKLLSKAAAEKRVTIDAAFVHAECDTAPNEAATEEEAKDEPWSLDDEFEDLVREEEFSRRDVPVRAAQEPDDDTARSPETGSDPEDPPSLAEALEHFGGLAEGWDDSESHASTSDENESDSVLVLTEAVAACDVANDEDETDGEEYEGGDSPDEPSLDPSPSLDAATDEPWTMPAAEEYDTDPLYALPTEAELRAIRGGWIRPFARPILVAALVAILGGLAIGRLMNADATTPALSEAQRSPREAHTGTREGLASDDRQADRPVPSPVAVEASANGEPLVLFRAGEGFVSPESIRDNQRPKEPASLPPQPEPLAPPAAAETGKEKPGGFGWDDLR